MSGAGRMISAGDPSRAQGIFTRALHNGLLIKTMMASAWAAGGGEGPHKHPPTSGSPSGKALGIHLPPDEKLGLVR